jgi:hypothetical protein
MTFRIFKSPPLVMVLVVALAGAACAGSRPAEPAVTGIVLGSEGRPLPPGIEAARIVEIDGETVTWSQSGHRLAPGRHVIRVVPRVEGPTEQVPSAEALATRWPNEPVAIDVVAGRTYVLGLRMLERLETAGRRGRWEAVVVSVAGAGG